MTRHPLLGEIDRLFAVGGSYEEVRACIDELLELEHGAWRPAAVGLWATACCIYERSDDERRQVAAHLYEVFGDPVRRAQSLLAMAAGRPALAAELLPQVVGELRAHAEVIQEMLAVADTLRDG
ncbi:hypothetical protein Hoch_4927 [Haliangium ochraceum DSM 14365]|uniref:Uncharacterized protein n=2 Tax=Haliangium ochraceum TaxID=80816 RepID=D0LU52_HALO1|nr:hypothetical protein Hoch_4927 [Haliangium ochraceum DSM 14365]